MYSLNNQELVKQFMIGFNQIDGSNDYSFNVNDLTFKDIKNTKLRLTLTLEKTQELFESFLSNEFYSYHFEPLFNILKNKIQMVSESNTEINKIDVANTLADLEYINNGTAVWLNIPLQKCFLEVHKSNMSKLINFTGKPILRVDGKILYDTSYTPPNIKSIIDSHTSD